MSALSSKGNHLAVDPALLALPVNDGSFSQFASVQKDVKRHKNAERPHGDAHSSVANGIVRHILKEHRQTTWHIPTPPSDSYIERLKIGPFCLNKGNTVTKLANHVFDEWLVCDAPVPDADNGKLPALFASPANDNDPDWREAEAA